MAYEFEPPIDPPEYFYPPDPDISMTVFCSYCGLKFYDQGDVPDICPDCGKVGGMLEVED